MRRHSHPRRAATAIAVLAACSSTDNDGESGALDPTTSASDATDPTASPSTTGTDPSGTTQHAETTAPAPDSSDAESTAADVTTSAEPPPLNECDVAEAEWIFCDSFEADGTWDGSTTNPVLVEVPGPFDTAGNHAAQLRVPPGSGGASLYKDLPVQDAAYLRFYVMWEPGHDFTAPRHGPGGLHGGNTDCVGCSGSTPTDWFTSTLETVTESPYTMQAYTYYPGMYMDCADPNGSCWGDMFPCTAGPSYCTNPAHAPQVEQAGMQAGQWYCIEQMIDAGTPSAGPEDASGVLDFWIDGVDIGPWSELWLRSSADVRISAVWLYLYHHAEHSPEGMLLDNVVVSTARVGCPG